MLYPNYEFTIKKINNNTITFDQLIEEAINLNKYNCHFKHILIDEYQDISNQRFLLINKYVKIENSKLMCVGDDWQTIFSFASSNIQKILKFSNEFSDVKILKILMTYRNSQQLVDIAGNFVMKNNQQISKKLRSTKQLTNPIEVLYYKNKSEKIIKISLILDELFQKNPNLKIAFLSRYRFELNELIDNKHFNYKDNILYYKQKEILFYTIHTSKGLGFDYVFILNNKTGYYGFPAKRPNRSLFKEEKAYYEERRLFYVALTRTKNKVYLLVPNKGSSVFAKEIKNVLKKNKYLI